jgi:valyl-tRNA synthetase
VEPRLSPQWYMKMAPLAEPAIAAVEDGRTRFAPAKWSKTYFEWMRNIRDWCISRQLWWGHRIPAWTCANGHTTVARQDPSACAECGNRDLAQSTDVLDTWFSSGLFPFVTLGWPEKTRELSRYYPNDVMMTGFDIIFFWVARMMMLGLRFMGDVPFRTVFINGLVRDDKGEKMSKTRGNDVDPLDLIARHGTDAVRFTLTALAAAGTDPSLGEERLVGYKAFVNKLWNASRFVLMNLQGERAASYAFSELPQPSRWILSRLQAVAAEVNAALGEFRFDQAANALYHFVWDELCDWYIEIAKTYLADPAQAPVARAVLLEALETTLRLLHPILPFVTEEIWQRLPHEGPSVMVAPFPTPDPAKADAEAEREMAALMRLVTAIRTLRATYEVEPRRRIDVTLVAPGGGGAAAAQAELVRALARLERLDIVPQDADRPQTIKQPVDGMEIRIPMAGLFDIEAERARLGREREKVQAEAEGLRRRLENPQFVERAKPAVVAESREKLGALLSRLGQIAGLLDEMGAS